MRKLILLLVVICFCITTVSAMEFTAPSVPESADEYMPRESESFGKDLWYIIKTAIAKLQPSIAEAAGVCVSLIAVNLLISLLKSFSGITSKTVDLVGTLAVGVLLLRPSNALIQLGVETVRQLSEYGKLLLPVMTAAMAAEGGTATSAALYTGTVIFNSFLTSLISNLITPIIYIHIALCIAVAATGEELLKNLRDFTKWLMTWCLKITIYLFTGYMGITGVVSGTTDAAALKAAKLAMSGFVPVVGNIISDASEAVLVSAGVMKSAAGVYGLLAILAVWISPFLQIGVQYLLLKLTASVCGMLGSKNTVGLVHDYTGVMGLLLAMTGTVCLLLLISTVCFMKGVT